MRLFFLTALLGGTLTAAQAAPPGYHAPRHYYTPRKQPYRRPPVRLTISGNLATYNGDITGRLADNTLRLGLGLGLVHALSPHLTYGLELSYFQLKAKDEYPSRGYSFESTNGLFTTFLRYNLFADKSMYIGQNYKPIVAQIFVQAGVGAVLYNPSLSQQTGDGLVALPPEVRGGYPGVAGAFPVGGGVTLKVSRAVNFTLEGLYYFTTTDLLDDVSQRANPKMTDNFGTLTFKMEYAFYKKHGKPLVHND